MDDARQPQLQQPEGHSGRVHRDAVAAEYIHLLVMVVVVIVVVVVATAVVVVVLVVLVVVVVVVVVVRAGGSVVEDSVEVRFQPRDRRARHKWRHDPVTTRASSTSRTSSTSSTSNVVPQVWMWLQHAKQAQRMVGGRSIGAVSVADSAVRRRGHACGQVAVHQHLLRRLLQTPHQRAACATAAAPPTIATSRTATTTTTAAATAATAATNTNSSYTIHHLQLLGCPEERGRRVAAQVQVHAARPHGGVRLLQQLVGQPQWVLLLLLLLLPLLLLLQLLREGGKLLLRWLEATSQSMQNAREERRLRCGHQKGATTTATATIITGSGSSSATATTTTTTARCQLRVAVALHDGAHKRLGRVHVARGHQTRHAGRHAPHVVAACGVP
jgi:hypothetical protein